MSKKSTTETGPSKFAQPYITGAANAVQGAYQGNQQNLQNISSVLQNNMGSVLGSTLNSPGMAAANGYNTDVLNGNYLTGNPHLQAMIDQTSGDVSNKVNAAIGQRGGAGGSAQAQIMARELAKNETGLRYQDYSNERNAQQQAVGGAANLAGANSSNINSMLGYLQQQATLPQSGANSYAASIGGLMGGYNNTTQTQGLGNSLSGILGAGLSGWAGGGFKGLK